MISLSAPLNNAELYNRSQSLMAEIDKNNFPHSQQTASLFMHLAQKHQRGWQHKQNQNAYFGFTVRHYTHL